MHQIQATVAAIDTALDAAIDANLTFLFSTTDKRQTLLGLLRLESRLAELRMRVVSANHDVTDETAARDVAAWLVAQKVIDRRRAHALLALAQPRVAALDADGRVRPRHRVYADAFAHLLETADSHHLPMHGGDATTVVVTVPLEALQKELATAHLGGTTGSAPVRSGGCSAPRRSSPPSSAAGPNPSTWAGPHASSPLGSG